MAQDRPDYHIFLIPAGQKHNLVESLTPKTEYVDENEKVVATDHGPAVFTRRIWDAMVSRSIQTDQPLRHPDDGRYIKYAELRYGGHLDAAGNGHGGVLCQKWSPETGLVKVYEPDPSWNASAPEPEAQAEAPADATATGEEAATDYEGDRGDESENEPITLTNSKSGLTSDLVEGVPDEVESPLTTDAPTEEAPAAEAPEAEAVASETAVEALTEQPITEAPADATATELPTEEPAA